MWKNLLAALSWSSRQSFLFVVFLAAFILAPLIFGGNTLNNALLWLTGVVVLLYTVETHGLRIEMVRQNEMAIQPLLIATIEERTAIETKNVLVLRNIGRGAALFVKIEDVEFLELEGQRYVMKFNTIDFIEPGKDHIAQLDIFRGNEKTASEAYISHLDPRYAIQTLVVVIIYEDVNGQRRESVVQMGKEGIRLLRHGKAVRKEKTKAGKS